MKSKMSTVVIVLILIAGLVVASAETRVGIEDLAIEDGAIVL
jgi:hypothetical protein